MATKEIGATGRRKTAIARVRLTPGTGKLSVNERGLDDYFPRPTARMIIAQPFQLAKAEAAYDAIIKVTGGGVSAQASAIRHAISQKSMPHACGNRMNPQPVTILAPSKNQSRLTAG